MKKNIILGVNYGGHDCAAALMINGKLVASCEEERFNLEKHTRKFPSNAINECLKIAGIGKNDVTRIAVGYDQKKLIRERFLNLAIKDEKYIDPLIRDINLVKWVYGIDKEIKKFIGNHAKFDIHEHHLCHLASTYYPSGYKKSLLVSYDGKGEIASGMFGVGNNGIVRNLNYFKNDYPDSLGLIYSAITFYLGWRPNCDEGIIMGLAPYGNPFKKIKKLNQRYIDIFRKIIIKKNKYSFEINQDWISYHLIRNKWVSDKFIKIFGSKRQYDSPINQKHKDIAAALQLRVEEIIIAQLKSLKKETGINKLCLAGGVALNCSLNGKIERSKIFDEIFVTPASGDAGIPLGACYLSHKKISKNFNFKKNYNFYLGSNFKRNMINKTLKKYKINFHDYKNKIYSVTADLIAKGKIIGWFHGSAELGPRALGNRSILCKPYPLKMKDYINKKVKFREPFRPFAPAVLKEYQSDFFEINQDSYHMLIACKVKKNKKNLIPATVHIDDTCRVQTVDKKINLNFYNLLKEFYKITKIPVLLNTSFNIKGQPIVNNPNQAIECFLNTKIDYLVIDNFLISKN
tara:strand:+ start:1038 stop:2759 length:1722 start_codon:yes stop_codon:yes gene_type:complete